MSFSGERWLLPGVCSAALQVGIRSVRRISVFSHPDPCAQTAILGAIVAAMLLFLRSLMRAAIFAKVTEIHDRRPG
eukprot:scaffold8003_cov286-Pinguiococcus_pyrenoidosus.AAC.1